MKHIPWFELASSTKKELNTDAPIREYRMEKIGHSSPLRPRWLHSIGMWGGIATAPEIAEAVKLDDPQRVRVYANMTALRYRRLGKPAQHQVAIASRTRICSPEELGIYPLEHAYYVRAYAMAAGQKGMTPARFSRCSPTEQIASWDAGGLWLSFPTTQQEKRHAEAIDTLLFR